MKRRHHLTTTTKRVDHRQQWLQVFFVFVNVVLICQAFEGFNPKVLFGWNAVAAAAATTKKSVVLALSSSPQPPPPPPPKPQRRLNGRERKFYAMLDRLQEHKARTGHTYVSSLDGDPELYRWTRSIRNNYRHQRVSKQADEMSSLTTTCKIRMKRKRPKLSTEKLRLLDEIDFCWNVQELFWERRYQQLCEFHKEYGHCMVPSSMMLTTPRFLAFEGLGVWVQNQRREYKRFMNGENSTLTTARLRALEELHFLQGYKTHQESWDERYQQLLEFNAQHGHSNVPQTYPENYALGQWCMNQRTARRRQEEGPFDAGLTQERIQLLDAINFQWNVRDVKWNQMLDRLQQYHAQHNHTTIDTADAMNRDLRIWLIVQRHHYNRKQHEQSSSLTQERIDALETAIPNFSWKARQGDSGPSVEDWSELFQAMRTMGIEPGMRPKQHWFEGTNPLQDEVKNLWTDEDLLELWNQEADNDDDYDNI